MRIILLLLLLIGSAFQIWNVSNTPSLANMIYTAITIGSTFYIAVSMANNKD